MDRFPWDRMDEIAFLLLGYMVGFGLIMCEMRVDGMKVIDTITGATLMYLKGRSGA